MDFLFCSCFLVGRLHSAALPKVLAPGTFLGSENARTNMRVPSGELPIFLAAGQKLCPPGLWEPTHSTHVPNSTRSPGKSESRQAGLPPHPPKTLQPKTRSTGHAQPSPAMKGAREPGHENSSDKEAGENERVRVHSKLEMISMES